MLSNEGGAYTAALSAPSESEVGALEGQAWHYLDEDAEQQGPLEISHLVDLCADGVVCTDTPVWCSALGEWQPLEAVSVLKWMVAQARPHEEAAIWYVYDGESNQLGPLTAAKVGELRKQGAITADSAVWSAAQGEWARLSEVAALS